MGTCHRTHAGTEVRGTESNAGGAVCCEARMARESAAAMSPAESAMASAGTMPATLRTHRHYGNCKEERREDQKATHTGIIRRFFGVKTASNRLFLLTLFRRGFLGSWLLRLLCSRLANRFCRSFLCLDGLRSLRLRSDLLYSGRVRSRGLSRSFRRRCGYSRRSLTACLPNRGHWRHRGRSCRRLFLALALRFALSHWHGRGRRSNSLRTPSAFARRRRWRRRWRRRQRLQELQRFRPRAQFAIQQQHEHIIRNFRIRRHLRRDVQFRHLGQRNLLLHLAPFGEEVLDLLHDALLPRRHGQKQHHLRTRR